MISREKVANIFLAGVGTTNVVHAPSSNTMKTIHEGSRIECRDIHIASLFTSIKQERESCSPESNATNSLSLAVLRSSARPCVTSCNQVMRS